MADEWQAYVQDSRIVCKYGSKCYQENADHHEKFKHPPSKNKKENVRKNKRFSPYTRNDKNNTPSASSVKTDEPKTPIHSSCASPRKTDSENITIDIPKDVTMYDMNVDKNIFREFFLVEMPQDFFDFFEFLKDNGKTAEETLATVNLELIGPYDLLLGKLPILDDKKLYLIHWRFFYDPPEFQAVLKKKNSEYHIGYFRDSPEEMPAFLGSNDSSKDCRITLMGDNIFGTVYLYLQNEKKRSPFSAMSCQKLIDKIKLYAENNNIPLEEYNMKKRLPQIVTKTFHGAGIVVPYNKKTQLGYRRLHESDANLKKMFTNLQNAKSQEEKDKVLSDLQAVVTYASIAVDECDFGTGLEIGIALFCSGLKELQTIALSNFTSTYSVLNRKPFAQIAEVHLKYRRKGSKMSLLA